MERCLKMTKKSAEDIVTENIMNKLSELIPKERLKKFQEKLKSGKVNDEDWIGLISESEEKHEKKNK